MTYTTRDVADMLGLSVAQVLSFVRDGLVEPNRGARGSYGFSFQDLVLLRTAGDMARANIPAAKVRRALKNLKSTLPQGKPLTAVRVTVQGDEIVVRDQEQVWEPESGQIQLDFSVGDMAGKVSSLSKARVKEARAGGRGDLSADDWYNLGVDMEATAPEEAPDAYRRALELDENIVDAMINLGRLLQEQGEYDEAESLYRRAMKVQPDNPLASFNLGTLLEDCGRTHDAIEAYKRAAEALADAHYNLARLYDDMGQRVAALRHFQLFKSFPRN